MHSLWAEVSKSCSVEIRPVGRLGKEDPGLPIDK